MGAFKNQKKMNFKIKTINAILLIVTMTIFSSCKGQNISENRSATIKNKNTAIAIGDTVSKLGDQLMVIFQDKKNNYWFGGKGVYKYNGKLITHFMVKDGLCDTSILGIQEDKFGNIYFDTPEGISKFDGQKFTTLKILNNIISKHEWKLETDDLWFRMGWGKSGPYRYDGTSLYYLEFPKTEQEDKFYAAYPNASFNPYGIYSLYKDSKGLMWFGTSSLGACRYDGKSISWIYEEQMTTTSSGGALGIRSILEDKDGYFWFTNTRYYYDILSGNSKRNGTSYINYKKENGVGYSNENGEIDFPYFMSIIEDNNGDLWMVTYDEGVWRNNGKELIHYPVKDGGTNVLLFSIYKDNQGGLWLGTHNNGTYKFNGESFERFNP